MKKKVIIAALLAAIMLTGCENDSEAIEVSTVGVVSMTQIGRIMYYDNDTKIVYFWNGMYGQCATVPTVYYGEHGRLCKYIDGQIVEMEG